jgi:hypothetical protein
MHDAKWLGLTSLGVNFTGGETFTPGSPILELLAVARDIGTPGRANTNAWWGGRTHIKIGNHDFATDEDVIRALRDRKLVRLALSLDNRYDQYPNLLDSVIRVALLCEVASQPYEIVATDPLSRNRANCCEETDSSSRPHTLLADDSDGNCGHRCCCTSGPAIS